MEIGIKRKELYLNTEILKPSDLNISQNTELTRSNDPSPTKEEDSNLVINESIPYCSSPKMGLVSIHHSRKEKNNFIRLIEEKTDIPCTISIYMKQIKAEQIKAEQIKTDLDPENNTNNKLDINFFNKKNSTHIKPEKRKDKKPIIINSHSTIKSNESEKENIVSFKLTKRINFKKRMTKNYDKVKHVKKGEKFEKPKEKDKIYKRKSTSFSVSAISEKMKKIKKNLSKYNEIKEEVNEKIETRSIYKYKYKNKSKSKLKTENKDSTPNIIIYGSESSSGHEDKSKKENKRKEDYLKTKKHSNKSSRNKNNNKEEIFESEIIKYQSNQSSHLITKFKIKSKKNNRVNRKFITNNISNKNKINNKFNSANEDEKNKDKDKDKRKKKLSLLRKFTPKSLFKEDKEINNRKFRKSVSKNYLTIPKYSQISLKKNYIPSSKNIKDTKNMKIEIKPKINFDKVRDFKKKSNNNLRHSELDRSFIKHLSYSSNTHIPHIRIDIKTQENDNNDIHLVVKGKEETIINYTNQQRIEDEKDYMIDCLKILAKLKKEEMPRCKQKVNFHFSPEEQQKKIALFDLDETLVHCINNGPGMSGDYVNVKLPTNKTVKVGLNIRKNWKNALDLIMNHYNIVIYTASHPSYADAVLDYLDKDNKYFKYRLYRSHCIQCDVDGFKFYVKDLDTLNKYYNLKDIVIIDNSILSFAYHLYNGIPIVPFIDQPNDTELMFTAHYLVSIANYEDLSLENKKHLNLDNLLSMAKILNEMEDNEENEEEDEDEEGKINLININDTKESDSDKDEKKIKTNEESKENLEKNQNGENNQDSGEKKEKKEENIETKKFRGRSNVKQTKRTIKITEDMKKNIDEMLKKKKEELQTIDED